MNQVTKLLVSFVLNSLKHSEAELARIASGTSKGKSKAPASPPPPPPQPAVVREEPVGYFALGASQGFPMEEMAERLALDRGVFGKSALSETEISAAMTDVIRVLVKKKVVRTTLQGPPGKEVVMVSWVAAPGAGE